MKWLEVMYGFTAIFFPIFLALPSFMVYIAPSPSVLLRNVTGACFIICTFDLWVTTIGTLVFLTCRGGLPNLVVSIVVVLSTLAITVLLYYLARGLIEAVLFRAIFKKNLRFGIGSESVF